ncbi:MAG: carboxypeptidase-like regulatory domain-containing protein [Alloprevotella sp.]|nr:carboxypeptidase-like regulatory domain-containing protein [Alloprevotella sp.]
MKLSSSRSLTMTGLFLFFPLLSLLALCLPPSIVRVTGKVVSQSSGTPLEHVLVIDSRSRVVLASTDADGRFAIDFHDGGTLRFQLIGVEPVTVKLKSGQTFVEVRMADLDVNLDEAVVTVKRERKKIMPEPTDIEVRGNYLHVRTRVRVPSEIFSPNTRLVVQPILTDATDHRNTLMRPLVFDGEEYHRTQLRMYDYKLEGRDPLAPYTGVRSKATRERDTQDNNDIIGYADSIYVQDVHHDFSCDVFMALEDYQKIFYRDTVTIARGTVNPLRFLEYDFPPVPLTDPAYIPQVEKQLRDTQGEINLLFPIGKSDLDLSLGSNREELDKLNRQLDSLSSGRGTILQRFDITGTASPDGPYAVNQKLADRRMQSALNYIVSRLDSETRQNLEVGSQAHVASWNDVAALLRADSLFDKAEAVEAVTRRFQSTDAQGRELRRSGFYNLMLENYCPRLRRVEYQLQYSIFRQLTFDEIKELYAQDYHQLSRFEFYTLFQGEKNDSLRERQLRQALEVYPSFTLAACNLSEMLIQQKRPDPEITKPFAGKKAPMAINANHVIALMAQSRYDAADTIAAYLPDVEETRLVKAVVGMLNGYFEENYAVVATSGQQNEVVALMAMKKNGEALEKARLLPKDKAISHYLLASCLNRMEDVSNAVVELKEALRMDPDLEQTAKVDGDVNDILELAKK